MTLTEENRFILIQFFLVDPLSQRPKIHPKRLEMKKNRLIKELRDMISDYKESEIDIELEPYQEALKVVKEIKTAEEYSDFIDDLLRNYL